MTPGAGRLHLSDRLLSSHDRFSLDKGLSTTHDRRDQLPRIVQRRPTKEGKGMRRAAFALTVLVSVAVALTTAGITSAGQAATVCTTTLGPITVGNVVVPAGAHCVLDGTSVAGNVTVQSGNGTLESGGILTTSTASAGAGPTINGNVVIEADGIADVRFALVRGNHQCNGCSYADLHSSIVKGNFQDNGLLEGVFFDFNTIGGNLEIVNSFGGGFGFSISHSSVGGNLQFEGNLGDPFSDISTSAIKGNLQCDGNTPAPTGSGNSAKQKLGQCAGL